MKKLLDRKLSLLMFLTFTLLHLAQAQKATTMKSGYAPVNGLKMYYEIHGAGQPLVVLHGAYMNIPGPMEVFGKALAKDRRVILVEFQGHGRTADIEDRPLTYEQLADDVAALLRHLKITQADVFGYSMGGTTALQVAIRHPELVRKLVAVSASYNSEGWQPELSALIPTLTPEMFEGTPFKQAYDSLAPQPEHWPRLVDKLKTLDMAPQDWPASVIQGIQSPTLLIVGDADVIRLEHAVDMFRLLGGGAFGDLHGLPNSQLAVLPGATHIGVMEQTDRLAELVGRFLEREVK